MKKLTIVLFSTILMAACSSEDISEQRTLNNGNVCFTPQMASDWNAPWTTRAEAEANTTVQTLQGAEGLYLHTNVQRGIRTATSWRQYDITRGGLYTGHDDGNGHITFATTESFRVSGYRYASNSNVSTVAAPNFLNNAVVQYVSTKWKATQDYVMPASTDLIDFFAWFVPTGTSGVTADNGAGGTQLTYTVPEDIDEQPDLLAAVTRSQTYDPRESYSVDMEFTHQLTAINFELDENVAPGSITEIAFLKVYTTATLSIGGSWDTTQGTAPAATAYAVNFPTVENDAIREGENIIGPLMMIPQDFTETDQQIRIQMQIDGEAEPRLLYADLKGTKWEPNTTVTYKISTSAVNVLRISGVSYPTSWSAASVENSNIKNAYANGDEIGVYAVDGEGNVVYTNKKYTWNGTSWVSGDATQSLYVPGCTYYAYYPYQTTLSGGPSENTNVLVGEALPTAAQFFSTALTNWTPAENQSTAALLNAQDLQIGQSAPGNVSTVSFPTMTHAMGLTSLALEKEISETRYYKVDNNGAETTEYFNSDDSITFSVSDNFEMKERMLANDKTYYYVVNPEATTVVVNGPTTGNNPWEAATINLEAPVGTYQKYCAITRNYKYHGNAYYYRNKGQQILVPATGEYFIECWGAAGGGAVEDKYCGGYVAGKVTLTANQALYVYVGQQGFGYNTNYSSSLMFNGGGTVSKSNSHAWGAGGGGATDIRTSYNSSWSNSTSLNSRIIIAGGGGGGVGGLHETSCAGGLNGYPGRKGYDSSNQTYWNERQGYGGKQNGGGQAPTMYSGAQSTGTAGQFGYGGNGGASASSADVGGGSGGGGGLYGGSGASGLANGIWDGGGGSSYISGHTGCTAKSITFSSTVMIDGAGYQWTTTSRGSRIMQPAPEGGEKQYGQIGNGFCRIKTPVID